MIRGPGNPDFSPKIPEPDPEEIRGLALRLVKSLMDLEALQQAKAPKIILEGTQKLVNSTQEEWIRVLPSSEREESRAMEKAYREAVVEASLIKFRDVAVHKFLEKLLDAINGNKPVKSLLSQKMLGNIDHLLDATDLSSLDQKLDFLKQKLSIPEDEFNKLIEKGQKMATHENEFLLFAEVLACLEEDGE